MSATDRKTEILEAAQELIQSHGYTGFSYQDLSDRLGLAKPSLHHHFGTKEELGLALIESYHGMLAGMQEAVLSASDSPAEQLRALLRFGDEDAEHRKHCICPGGALHANYLVFPASMQRATEELSEAMHRFVTDILARGRERGEIRFEGEPSDEAWALMSALQGGRAQARTHGMDVWHAVARQVESSLLGGS